MKKLLIISALALGLNACDNSDEPGGNMDNKPQLYIALSDTETPAVVSTNNFGFRLFNSISNDAIDENVFFSPLVASLNMSMVANAAAGETRAEILNALGLNESQITDLNTAMNKLITALPDADNKTNLTLASSVWLADLCKPSDAFKNICSNSYKAGVNTYPFNSPSIASEINKWCSDKTCGAIKQIVNQKEMEQSKFAIANATIFKSEWYRKYSNYTGDGIFHTTNHGDCKVPMIQKHFDSSAITVTNKLSMTTDAFGNGSFRIAFILPHEDVSINEAIQSLDADTWISIQDADYFGRDFYEITLIAPKLNLNTEYDMLKYYYKLGITSAMTSDANFSELGTSAMLTLSRQKAQFKMDEKGAEAVVAQVTVGGETSPGPNWTEKKEFRLDRPFAFVIYESSTKAIIFAGKVEKP